MENVILILCVCVILETYNLLLIEKYMKQKRTIAFHQSTIFYKIPRESYWDFPTCI